MTSLITLLLHPDRRRPAPAEIEVDLRRVFLGGMTAWAVALVACGALYLLGNTGLPTVLTCAAGLVLGVFGLLWTKPRRPPGTGA